MAKRNTYEEQQKRLQDLFDEASTPESSQDPYADDGEYGSDLDYQPSDLESSSSEDATSRPKSRRVQRTASIRSGESASSSSSSTCDQVDDLTSCCSDTEEGRNVSNSIYQIKTPAVSPSNISRVESLGVEQHSHVAQDQNDNIEASLNYISFERPASVSLKCDEHINEEQCSNIFQNSSSANENNIEGISNPDASEIQMHVSQLVNDSRNVEVQPNVTQNTTTNRHSASCIPRREEVPLPEAPWSTTVTTVPDFNFDRSKCGITVNIDNKDNVLDFFHLVFPQNFVEYLVNCTNAYGNALCNTDRPHTRHSRKAVYRETNSEEIMKFLGLSLLKGNIKTPNQRSLFSLSDVLYYHPIFNYVMSGRRYEQILRCLCASELNAQGENKILKFIDMLTLNFREVYNPSEELSLDESLLLFRGRLNFRQYIKSKKARYGIKFYELTTHDGYVCNIKMYSGKEATEQNESESKTEKLVMKLMRPYLLRGHHIFMDNYYNSFTLSQKLLDLKTHSTGTLRANRKGNPKDITQKNIKKGEHVWARKNKVYVSKWKDKRPVLMITTKKHPSIIEVRNRFGKTKLKPAEVDMYNQYMSGVDRSDQMVAYYSCPRKTIRWYKKVLFHLLDIAVWNAYFLYKKYKKSNVCTYHYLHYRNELIKNMIGLNDNVKPRDLYSKSNIHDSRRFRPSTSVNTDNQVQPVTVSYPGNKMYGHWPEQILARPGVTKKFAFLKCKVCSKNNIRKETSYRCKGCPDKPPLCPSCFEVYHENLEQDST